MSVVVQIYAKTITVFSRNRAVVHISMNTAFEKMNFGWLIAAMSPARHLRGRVGVGAGLKVFRLQRSIFVRFA
jgi:hypothetical protein